MQTYLLSTQRNISRTKNLWNYSLADIYNIIRSGSYSYNDLIQPTTTIQLEPDHNKQNELKAQYLPYACINGRFRERSESGIIDYAPYTAIDFDQFGSEAELRQVAYWLTQIPCVQMLFRSPSGKGLKAIVAHTNTNPLKHRSLYHELMEKFLIEQTDTKTSDLSRATYLCYDPNVWWNSNCIPYQFDESKYPEDILTCNTGNGSVSVNGSYEEKVKVLNALVCDDKGVTDGSIKRIIGKWIEKEVIAEGERNCKLFVYGCKLCKAGVKYDYALQLVTDVFARLGLSIEEICNTTCNAYVKCSGEFGVDRENYGKKKR